MYAHSVKPDPLEPGGDGLVIYEAVGGTLVFRLWEIKKHESQDMISATIRRASKQLSSRGQEYLAKLAGPETAEQAGPLGELHAEIVELCSTAATGPASGCRWEPRWSTHRPGRGRSGRLRPRSRTSVARGSGLAIPRTSQAQWAYGKRVPASQVQPGDLVFFAGADGTPAAPGHVGIVIDPARHLMIVTHPVGSQ